MARKTKTETPEQKTLRRLGMERSTIELDEVRTIHFHLIAASTAFPWVAWSWAFADEENVDGGGFVLARFLNECVFIIPAPVYTEHDQAETFAEHVDGVRLEPVLAMDGWSVDMSGSAPRPFPSIVEAFRDYLHNTFIPSNTAALSWLSGAFTAERAPDGTDSGPIHCPVCHRSLSEPDLVEGTPYCSACMDLEDNERVVICAVCKRETRHVLMKGVTSGRDAWICTEHEHIEDRQLHDTCADCADSARSSMVPTLKPQPMHVVFGPGGGERWVCAQCMARSYDSAGHPLTPDEVRRQLEQEPPS